MSAFAAYADYYDLLYRDKDYRAEALFVRDLIRRHAADARTLLELGSGTGLHAIALAGLGFRLYGVDISPDMLAQARTRLAAAPDNIRGAVEFMQADMRRLSIERSFDAAVSLFHVMSYQIADADVQSAIAAARRHLSPGAPFVFDFWHGPAIATDGPQRREKTAATAELEIRRRTVPEWFPAHNKVVVRYDVTVLDKSTGRTGQFSESHAMRYFFVDELAAMLRAGGFEPAEWGEWLTGAAPKPSSFSVYCVAVAV